MTSENLETQVKALLERYASDVVMLDALLQWASNPTSMSGGYGLEENYPIITRNLHLRYKLSAQDADNRVGELKKVVDGLISVSKGSEAGIYEIRAGLWNALTKAETAANLKRGIAEKVGQASLIARCAVALANWAITEGVEAYVVDSLFDEPGTELRALLAAILGLLPGTRVSPFSEARDELVACGVINDLHYRSAKGNTRMMCKLAPFIPAVTLQEVVPREAMPSLDEYVAALFHSGMLDQARTIEEIATSNHRGMPGLLDYLDYGGWEVVPAKGVVGYAEGYIGSTRHTVAAVNPLVRESLLRSLAETKARRIAGPANEFGKVMRSFRDEMWPKGELTTFSEQPDRRIWRLDQVGVTRLFIYFGNWLNESDLRLLRERGAEPQGDSFIFAVMDQSLPSVERVVASSLKMWQKPSITVIFPSPKGMASHQLQSVAHPSLARMMELLSGEELPPPGSLVITLMVTPTSVLVGSEVTARVQVRDDKGNPVQGSRGSSIVG